MRLHQLSEFGNLKVLSLSFRENLKDRRKANLKGKRRDINEEKIKNRSSN
jgi:hypothetical protein